MWLVSQQCSPGKDWTFFNLSIIRILESNVLINICNLLVTWRNETRESTAVAMLYRTYHIQTRIWISRLPKFRKVFYFVISYNFSLVRKFLHFHWKLFENGQRCFFSKCLKACLFQFITNQEWNRAKATFCTQYPWCYDFSKKYHPSTAR